MLRRSKDRKTANLANKSGKQALIANAFGLPAGLAFSCPGATEICLAVCYAGKLEKIFPSMRALLLDNWAQVKDASQREIELLLIQMLNGFWADCIKRNADPQFRIHWDGDFFSREYAAAWANTVKRFPSIQFWVYTRSFAPGSNVVDLIADIPNLAVYLSVDVANEQYVDDIITEYPSVMVASLSDTMENAAEVIQRVRGDGKPGAKCPELIGALPLISLNGGACFTCQLCPQGKADIRFASSKAGRS